MSDAGQAKAAHWREANAYREAEATSHDMQQKYRPDIDGLRALAVALVVFSHSGLEAFRGGFVGVDVFFVISGFLITRIVATAADRGEFSLGEFYVRRMRRLFPALFLVIVFTTALFSNVLFPSDFDTYMESVVWVLLYLGNIFFWRENGGYFGASAEEAPLLHTWSLAVEEQYYLLWPVALLVMFRMFGRRRTGWAVAGLFVLCTYLSQVGTERTVGAAYYLLPTRAFELLIGSWLALVWDSRPALGRSSSHAISLVGLALIGFSLCTLDGTSQFPGYAALPVILGTSAIVLAETGIVNRALALTPIVFVGKISYSIYLWHWPILTYLRYTAVELTWPVLIAAWSTILALSVLSWRYVEQPSRRRGSDSVGRVFGREYALPSLFLLAAMLALDLHGPAASRPIEIQAMDTAVNSSTHLDRIGCHLSVREAGTLPERSCRFGAEGSRESAAVFLLGDSHANHIVPFLGVLLEDAGLVGQDYTMDMCRPVETEPDTYRGRQCDNRNKLATQQIMGGQYRYVILAAQWPMLEESGSARGGGERNFGDEIRALLSAVEGAGATPVIFDDMPNLGHVDPKCPLRTLAFGADLDCRFREKPNPGFSALLDTLAQEFAGLIVVRPAGLICTDHSCESQLGNIPLYRDADHLNRHGSVALGRRYLSMHRNPFARSSEHEPYLTQR